MIWRAGKHYTTRVSSSSAIADRLQTHPDQVLREGLHLVLASTTDLGCCGGDGSRCRPHGCANPSLRVSNAALDRRERLRNGCFQEFGRLRRIKVGLREIPGKFKDFGPKAEISGERGRF